MPTSRRKTGTCLTISPWKTVRRGRDRQKPMSDTEEVVATQVQPIPLESTVQRDQGEEFRSGIAELIKNEQLMIGRFAEDLDHGRRGRQGVGILAFECSGGNFFGALLDNTLQQIRWYINGEVVESSVQNCVHNGIGCQYYNMRVSDQNIAADEGQLVSMAVNSGGDAAKLTSVDVDESTTKDGVGVVFQCLQLYTNGSENSCFTKYFSHCSASEDLIINVGIMDVHQ